MFDMQGGHWLSLPERHVSGLETPIRGAGLRPRHRQLSVPVRSASGFSGCSVPMHDGAAGKR
jgi:hypothetical protein